MPDHIQKLLNEPTGREPERKICLRNVFEAHDFDPVLEYSLPSSDGTHGAVDIFLPSRHVLVEVKDEERLFDPYKPGTGSRPNESAYQQVRRYVLAERRRVQSLRTGVNELVGVWIGIVTDGRMFWLWEWDPSNIEGKTVSGWVARELSTEADIIALLRRLEEQNEGKRWAPADPTSVFSPFIPLFEKHFQRVKDLDATVTQYHLWQRQLEVSGKSMPNEVVDAEKLWEFIR